MRIEGGAMTEGKRAETPRNILHDESIVTDDALIAIASTCSNKEVALAAEQLLRRRRASSEGLREAAKEVLNILQHLSIVNFTDENCANLNVANKRIRNLVGPVLGRLRVELEREG